MLKAYTADSMSELRDMDYVRERSSGFIGTADSAGQVHMIREIIDNSVDELSLRPEGGTVYIALFKNNVTNKYQLAISDDGRGIPVKMLEKAVTQIGVSGKFKSSGAYQASSGLFGAGGKVAPALSHKYRAISQNYLDGTSGSVYVVNGKTQLVDISAKKLPKPGVLIVFEPDMKFFDNDKVFVSSGFLDLVNTCKQLNIFNEQINFQFYIYERTIPESFWTASVEKAVEIIDNLYRSKHRHVEYDTSSVDDKSAYLFDIWKMNSSIVFQDNYVKTPVGSKDRLGFNIKFYLTKKPANNHSAQYFISVNNVMIPDKTDNSATTSFLQILRSNIAPKIENDLHRKFLLEEYRFPTMMLAIGIKYHNAEFSGMTKTSFKDNEFAKQLISEVNAIIALREEDYWDKLTEVLLPDIVVRFNQMYEAPSKKSDDKLVFTGLNFPKSYSECYQYVDSELFIVEGDSAAAIEESRDSNNQAIYTTRGKPTNAATVYDHVEDNRKKLLKDPIYQDLMRILNINQNTTDFSNSRFKRIIIATDADPDGYHIRALHLNNFCILNPRIVESGMIWLANPPLYAMEVAKKKLYLRDKIALTDACIEFLYKPTLDITISTPAGLIKMDPDTTRDLYYLVNHIGEEYMRMAQQLNIPLLILERLVFAAEHLYPKINYIELMRCLESPSKSDNDFMKVQVNEVGKFIVLSLGTDDIVIPLTAIADTIISHLLPLDKKYRFRDMTFLVTSKHKGSQFNKQPMTIAMLYICLQKLNEFFSVSRFKGLGEMEEEDCFATIMNPLTRSLTQITDIGSFEDNYKLMGKDSTERKNLLKESSQILTHTFHNRR